MALKVKAKEREMKVGKYAGTYRYVMLPELYSALTQEKVIREAALRSGVSEGVMHACWDAAGEVIKAWATEGHSCPLPGLGTMRFGLSAKTVADVNEVKSSLITTRRIVFTPATELKDELKNTSVIITCYDREGNEVKRVTSADPGTIEDPESSLTPDPSPTGEGSSLTPNPSPTGEGSSLTPNPSPTGEGSGNSGGGTNTGGEGGDNGGGEGGDDPDQ